MKIFNISIHVLAGILGYAAFVTIVDALFKIYLFPKIDNPIPIGVGEMLGLPLIAIYCLLTRKKFKLNLLLGVIYFTLWITVVVKIVFFTW